ncbi:MAG: urea ABC transporter substrate-binding protein, partial [Schlesneria sp.]
FEYKRFLGRNDTPKETRNTEQNAIPATALASNGTPAIAIVPPSLPPLKVGILHSLTGPMAASERSIVDAFTFAIDEINEAGGLLGGRMIEPVIRDGKSYDSIFAEQAVELIDVEKVITIFGVWRSSCRQSVELACQDKKYLLIYPTSYEGLEESPHVIYMGGTANQQITPGIKWAYAFLGKRKFFLVGTDGMCSHGAHEIIKDELSALGASVVGNEFHSVSDSDFNPVAQQIGASGADMIVNSVVGIGNIHLFSSLRQAGIRADKVPVLSLNVTEEDLRTMAPRGEDAAGNYAAWSYFQSLPNPKNQQFIAKFHKRFGITRIISDPMVAAYNGMHLWALAVEASKSDRIEDIRKAIVQQQFDGPEGLVTIDPRTQNARRLALIGEVNRHLQFDVVWTSPRPLDPEPYPPSRTRAEWDEFVRSVRSRFSHQWSYNFD